jgi:hypothetical protein
MLKPNVISVLQKKSVKVQAVLEDDTLNNKPIHFGVYKIITRLLDLERFKFITILVLSSHATLYGIHSSPFCDS